MSRNVVIKDAVKTYGNFNAVDHANLEIQSGELFTLLGPSGCGKTTLLRMIAGFNSIDGGSIAFGETVINDVPAHKRNIGMVFQNYAIFPHMSVFENVAYGLKARKVKKEEIEERVMEALAMVQIENLKDRQPANMSGGQQQRLCIARAIAVKPQILLMDEPAASLDPVATMQLEETMFELKEDYSIIIVTHNMHQAARASDYTAFFYLGDLIEYDETKKIFQDAALQSTNDYVSGRFG